MVWLKQFKQTGKTSYKLPEYIYVWIENLHNEVCKVLEHN